MNITSGYSELAEEYYDRRHITSRNFEAATSNWTADHGCPIPDSGLVLDIGCGRGSVGAFCHLEPYRVVQGDIAMSMLTLSRREPSAARVACDALSMPFAAEAFMAVTAFLFDPFNKHAFLAESFRVLDRGGVFLGTLPHHQWGLSLRKLRGTKPDIAHFMTRTGQYVDKPSYLLDETDLRNILAATGYRMVEVHALTSDLLISPSKFHALHGIHEIRMS